MNRAVFLDRDGVLVRAFPDGDTTCGPRTADQLEILPGTLACIRRLRDAGYLSFVVTNQPGIARGLTSAHEQQDINFRLQHQITSDGVFMCPHDSADRCCCRKPLPGLVFYAAALNEVVLADSWLIGDRETDREAAIRAGIPQSQAIKIETNQGIGESVEWILKHSK